MKTLQEPPGVPTAAAVEVAEVVIATTRFATTRFATVPMAVGAGVFLLLGAAHLAATAASTPNGGPMSPVDPVIREAMVRPSGIGMAPDLRTELWRAWIGFNLSHALGIIVIAGLVLVQVLSGAEAALDRWWFLAVVFGVPPIYLGLSLRYWFRDPTIGIALGGVLLWTGAVIGLVA